MLHLSHVDLGPYSLASRALNKEANRILWRSVAVVPSMSPSSGNIRDFIIALKRDPVWAANIRHIKFVPKALRYKHHRTYVRSIFPDDLTEQLWASFEEALRLLIRVRIVCLHLHKDGLEGLHRLTNLVGRVFEQPHVARLDTVLDPGVLSSLCKGWRSLSTLSARMAPEDYFIELSPDALPRLRHVELSLGGICRIVPGRPIETIYHGGTACWLRKLEEFNRFRATLQSCKTLFRARVYCYAHSEDEAATSLPAFAHGKLRVFHFFITVGRAIPSGSRWLTPSLIMQALPSGISTYFPNLGFLQIILSHPTFRARHKDEIESEDLGGVANALSTFLSSESCAALNVVEISLWGGRKEDDGAFRFIATRCGGSWVVNVVEWTSSALPLFDES